MTDIRDLIAAEQTSRAVLEEAELNVSASQDQHRQTLIAINEAAPTASELDDNTLLQLTRIPSITQVADELHRRIRVIDSSFHLAGTSPFALRLRVNLRSGTERLVASLDTILTRFATGAPVQVLIDGPFGTFRHEVDLTGEWRDALTAAVERARTPHKKDAS